MLSKRKIFLAIVHTLMVLGAVAYLVYAVGWLSHSSGDTVCSGIDLTVREDSASGSVISTDDVQGILNSCNFDVEGRRMSDINLQQIQGRLKSNPYLDSVLCYGAASGKLCIDVHPAHPVLHVMNSAGDYYVDRSGRIMPSDKLNLDLCVVTGEFSMNYASQQLAALGRYIADHDFWRMQVQQIEVKATDNVQLTTRVGNQRILLGNLSELANKFHRLRKFYEQGMPNAGWNKYSTLSVEYEGQVVAKKKNK